MNYFKGLLPLVLVALCQCRQKNKTAYRVFFNDPSLFCKTVKKLNDVVLENNFPPMIASRNYVYANIAAYECIVKENSGFRSLAGQIKHLPEIVIPTSNAAVNYKLAALLAFTKVGNAVTFPEGSLMMHYNALKKMADSVGMPENEIRNSVIFSDSVADQVLRWSRKDNYAQTRTAEKYTVLQNSTGRWIPTPPNYVSAVEPHWREIRAMVLDSAAQFKPPLPPVFNVLDHRSVFFKAMMEVKNTGDSLTDEQKQIAGFWDDNPFNLVVVGHASYAVKKFSPPGHWMNIVGIASKKTDADFNTTVASYTQTAIALFDAFISCWDEKYRSNYIRPETAINKYVIDSWRPFIQTPPFPGYTSGHATISGAAAEIMTSWYGDHLLLTDTSLVEFGIKGRVLTSFRNAAKEAAISRFYGGIHYRFDNEEGNKMGIKIGNFILEKIKMKN
jgi:hypothetical protein